MLKRHGVELVLHGHDHIHSTMWLDGADRQIPAIGVPSASALAHRHYPAAAYNLFSIARDGEPMALRADRARHRRRLPRQADQAGDAARSGSAAGRAVLNPRRRSRRPAPSPPPPPSPAAIAACVAAGIAEAVRYCRRPT